MESSILNSNKKQNMLRQSVDFFAQNFKVKPLDCSRQAAKSDLIFWAILGAVCFLIIYGVHPLDVTDDRWILNSYVEQDVIQHYSGWMAFRKSDWTYPIGNFDAMSGGILTYTDSIPWASILFKLFRTVLPATFQFFGLYIFLAFILQGIAAGKLLRLLIDDKFAVCIGVVLFCFSPIMMERAFRHTALASHFLITFSLYFLFKSYYTKKMSLWYILIATVAIGTHPYFLPIVFSIIGANVLYLLGSGRATFLHSCFVSAAALTATVFAGYFIGALGGSSLSYDGYGYFNMNINALYNPTSAGGIKWSYILPVFPQMLGNYDGFNYLGLGVLLGIPPSLYYCCKHISGFLKKNWSIITVSIFMTAFAVSNTVTFNDSVVLRYPLPDDMLSFASIFRASSRIFYPVFYLIVLGVIVALYRLNVKKVLLLVILTVQLLDLSPVIYVKHNSFNNDSITAAFEKNPWYSNWQLAKLAETVKVLLPLEYIWNYELTAWGLKNNVDINVHFASSQYFGGGDETALYRGNMKRLESGSLGDQAGFITANQKLADDISSNMSDRYNIYHINGFYFIVNKNINLGRDKYAAANHG